MAAPLRRGRRQGPRRYDWALIEVTDPALASSDTSNAAATGVNWLLVRRRISDGEYAFYRAHAPRPVPVTDLVRVAGTRWKIEESFAGGKELAPWASTSSAPGDRGAAGACWPCSPTPSCPS